MYEIRKLNIWKEKENKNSFSYKIVVVDDAFVREELFLTMKYKEIFEEMSKLVPGINIKDIKERRGGKFRFPIYMNKTINESGVEVLELSVRAIHCLHRAGFNTVGELVENINESEDLKKIRNCGTKTVDEIMEQLFCYQYQQVKEEKKLKYINRIIELNKEAM